MPKKENYATGLAGQQAAEKYLKEKGYEILARNYRKPTGEIDLIAQDCGCLVFIEVKTRKGLGYGYPREAVNHTKQKRIARTALAYLTQHSLTESNIRFDVMEVLLQQGQIFVSHIENAFTG